MKPLLQFRSVPRLLHLRVDQLVEAAGLVEVAALAVADADERLLAVDFLDLDFDLLVAVGACEEGGVEFVDLGFGEEELGFGDGRFGGFGDNGGGGVKNHLELAEFVDGHGVAGWVERDGAAAGERADEREDRKGGNAEVFHRTERKGRPPRWQAA